MTALPETNPYLVLSVSSFFAGSMVEGWANKIHQTGRFPTMAQLILSKESVVFPHDMPIADRMTFKTLMGRCGLHFQGKTVGIIPPSCS